MTLQIDLSPEADALLRARASEAGGAPERVAALLLEDKLRSEAADDADAELTQEERAAVRAGLARGLADSAAGRVKPAEAVYARLQAEQGVTW